MINHELTRKSLARKKEKRKLEKNKLFSIKMAQDSEIKLLEIMRATVL